MATKSPSVKQPANPNHGQVLAQHQQWSGPLPPPAALDQFNQIIPNGAERIMAMVEREQAHRISEESAILSATIKDTARGHWIGLLIASASISGAVWTAYIGSHPTVSIALVGLPLVAIIQSILKNKSNGK
jgi:uncharacterized membrane protein